MGSQKLLLSLALFAALFAVSFAFPYPYHPYPGYQGNYRHQFNYRYRNNNKYNPRKYSPEKEVVPSEGGEEYYYPGSEDLPEQEFTPETPSQEEEEVPTPKEYTPKYPVPRKPKTENNNKDYTPTTSSGPQQEYLNAHNRPRSEAGVGPLKWDENLAQHAMDHASRLAHSGCDLFHYGGPFGENLAMGGGKLSPSEAVDMWMEEKSNYNYGYGVSGHYTQIMWRHSNSLGCAKATCDNNAGEIVSCLYFPPGNVIGEKPY